ncbi:hypothetical protein NMK71_04030 [Weeksellaceae bacterium KMM 9713]|uniref:Vitellogenin II n=1 Tax=Profundicola chukchiensis TaxID=2961959 RepID=A0A9X4MZ25_9FLAO|nr:hypothetical protein [Profundicola chukchiensis]MDG4945572.1 hypothetical protein [Profundicola chukchiensis]
MKPTKYNYDQIFKKILPVGMILFGVTSCSVSQQTVGENDGIYYDPSSQPTRQVVVEDREYQQSDEVYTYQEEQPIRMGGRYFDDSGNAPETSQTTQQESRSYNDDSVVVTNDSNGNYNDWGDYQGVEIHVNNYYGPLTYNWNRRFYGGWYGPYRSFGWNYGWSSWGYSPFYSGYYGFGYPYFGYGYGYSGFYGPFHPYYGPYYYGSYGYYGHPYYSGYYGSPYYNNYYGNRVMREIYRGKGIQNGITRDNVAGQRNVTRTNSGITRDNATLTPNSPTRTRATSTVGDNQIRTTPTRNSRNQNVSSDINTNPVRIRPRTTEEVNTNSGVRTNNRVNPNIRSTTPIRQNDVRNTPRPTRRDTRYNNNVPTRTPKVTPSTPPTRNRNYNSTPSRPTSPSIRSTPSVRPSAPVRSSGGIRRR